MIACKYGKFFYRARLFLVFGLLCKVFGREGQKSEKFKPKAIGMTRDLVIAPCPHFVG